MQSDFLGLILLAQGAISREDLYAGLRRQAHSGEVLGAALLSMGAIDPADLERGVAAQIGAPLFELEWLPESLPEPPVPVPDGLDAVFLHRDERVEIWGVRTPGGRQWLEERARDLEAQLGVYTLPDRYWEPTRADLNEERDHDSDSEDAYLTLHEAIEMMYEAEEFQELIKILGRGLADICSRVTAGVVPHNEPAPVLVYQSEGAPPLEALPHRESLGSWHVEPAPAELLETCGPHGWCLSFQDASAGCALVGVFDNAIDDPVVFEDLTREFESAHKLLMERVNSG